MKKCDYCGKELDSYHIMYCRDTDCEDKAMRFYDRRRRLEKAFGIINVGCMLLLVIGLLMSVFAPVYGNAFSAIILAVMALVVFIMPFGPDLFYHKWRIKKTNAVVRFVGFLLLLGSAAFVLQMIYHMNHQ